MREVKRQISILLAVLLPSFLLLNSIIYTAKALPTITEYQVPSPNNLYAFMTSITSGSDGNVWFVQNGDNDIGSITPNGTVQLYSQLNHGTDPYQITNGPDGALWFTQQSIDTAHYGGEIGRTTTSGDISEYHLDSQYYAAYAITNGPDGALWFTEIGSGVSAIGRITTSGQITNYPLVNIGAIPYITTGPDGALWFTNAQSHSIYRMTTSGLLTQFPMSLNTTEPGAITTGPDGALWFTEGTTSAIGRITTDGTITEYPTPTQDSGPGGITTGPDGALWFTEGTTSAIGRITTDGTITEYPTPTQDSRPAGITSGPGGLWFTELGYVTETPINNIGFVSVSPQNINAPTNLFSNTPIQLPSLTWDSVSSATSYNIYRDGTNIASSTDNSYTDTTATEGNHSYYVTAVNSSSESGSSNTINVLVDRTSPALGTLSWSANPIAAGSNTALTVPANDTSSGVASGEYYLGTTDPGQGNGTSMTYGSGNLTATFGSSLTSGIYQVNVRAVDNAGNWSAVTTDYLVVYNPASGGISGHSNTMVPTYGIDLLPGLSQSGQTDTASFALTTKYDSSGNITTNSKLKFSYSTGTHCNNASQATNCHSLTLDSTSISWLIVSGTNNSQGAIQGFATLTVDGVTTTNPFSVIGIDGALLNPQTNDTFTLKIFAPGANPNTATPIYHLNVNIVKGSIKIS